MRRVVAGMLVSLVAASAAHASSIITAPEAGSETPSIITLGSAEPPTLEGTPIGAAAETPRFQVGPSIVAFGAEAIPSAPIEVASIDTQAEAEPEEPRHAPLPFVIRGGILGDAFSAPPADEVELPEEAEVDDEVTDPAEPSEQPG